MCSCCFNKFIFCLFGVLCVGFKSNCVLYLNKQWFLVWVYIKLFFMWFSGCCKLSVVLVKRLNRRFGLGEVLVMDVGIKSIIVVQLMVVLILILLVDCVI